MPDTTLPSPFSDLPLWMKAVAVIGFPSAMSGVLLYVLVGQLQTDSTAHIEGTKVHIASMEQALESNRKVHRDTLHVLQSLCLNSAKSDEHRQRCLVSQ